MVTSLASASGLPLYFSAREAQDGAFLVVVAVWHLLHFCAAMMSSADPAKAGAAATTAMMAAIVSDSFMGVSFDEIVGGWKARDDPCASSAQRAAQARAGRFWG